MSNEAPLRRIRRAHTWAAVGSVAVVAATLTACGSSDDAGDASGSSSSAGGSDSALAADLAAFTKPLDAYPVPTDPISDVGSLKGKTVYYIPITQQSVQFNVTQKGLEAAGDAVGITVQTCDGKGTPTDIGACIGQATDAGAGAIITDAIAYGLAANGLDAAQAAGIPVIISNQVVDDAHPASATLDYVAAGGSQMEEALASWVIQDSGGKAQVLMDMSTDGPSPAVFAAAGQKVYDENCPDCDVTVNNVSTSSFSQIPSSTSAALLQNPDVDYVEAQFEQYAQAVQAGIQQTSRTDVKVIAGAAELGGIKQVESGSLAAAAAQAAAFQGWVDMDAAMRLMLGVDVPEYTIPVRLFTQDTMDDVQLTDEAQQSGEWFGPATYTDDFQKVWGIG